MDVSKRLRELRLDSGLSQQDVADKLNVTRVSVGKWEAGTSVPRPNKLEELASLFGTTVSYLLGDDVPGPFVKIGKPIVGRSALVPMRRLGITHAGESVEEIPEDDVVEVPESVAKRHPNAFMLGVEGDCMDRSYPPGCLVMVDPDMEPWNGCAVVAETAPGESVMRRYMRGAATLMLSPDSFEEHEDIIYSGDSCEEVRLLGVVVWYQAERDEARR